MQDRFTRFTLGISRLNKQINKLKVEGMQPLGLKAAHAMCIHQLSCEDRLSFPQLCERCDLDPALISRTLKELCASGHAVKDGSPGKYNARYSLTPSGRQAAGYIGDVVYRVISGADEGIDPQELNSFYHVLEQLIHNFDRMSGHPQTVLPGAQGPGKGGRQP